MITLRPAEERGIFKKGWLDTRHSFSFGNYVDGRHHHFRALRVINEDRIQPGKGFSTHPHRDMEIVTWLLAGTLAHEDSDYHSSVLRPGDVQRMSAGIGIEHSEINHSASELCHLLQIWVFPQETGGPPSYEQKHFEMEARRNRVQLIVTPDGIDGSLRWQQDAQLMATVLDPGSLVSVTLAEGRHAWIQVARGKVRLNDLDLKAGDGAALSEESAFTLEGLTETEVLIFDLA